MGYSYEYNVTASDATEMIVAFFMMFLLVYLLVLAFAVVTYVLESLGVYTIAKRRGIKNPWLAWLPVGNMWMWGCISDQYQYVAKGRVRNRRKVLLALNIVMMVLAAVLSFQYAGFVVDLALNGAQMEYMTEAQIMETILSSVMGIIGVAMICLVVGIVTMVFQYIALYDLYTSCDPNNNVMYLVLSIFLNVTRPFFIFCNRKKDLGMPPRKPEPAYQPIPQPPVDPWEQNQA